MPRVPYSKPALSFQDQLQQLKDRGLVIEDDKKAIFLLENISYYRLSVQIFKSAFDMSAPWSSSPF